MKKISIFKGDAGTGTMFVVILMLIVGAVSFTLIGGQLPKIKSSKTGTPVVLVTLSPHDAKNNLQLYTFIGMTITPSPTPTPNPESTPTPTQNPQAIPTLTTQPATPPANNCSPSPSTCTKTVAKDGSGGYSTIQAAANAAVAGDTVCVKAGTYNEYVTVKNSGTAGNPITFKAIGTVTVKYPGTSMPTYSGIFWVKGKQYIVIDGFKTIGGYTGIQVDTSSNVILKNNYIQDSYTSGIKIGWGYQQYITITNNIVNRDGSTGSPIEYNEMISLSDTHNSEVRNNYVMHNIQGEAIVIKDKSSFIKVYNNKVEHSKVGVYAGGSQGAHDIEIYNNIAVDNLTVAKNDGAGIYAANEMSHVPPVAPTNIFVHDNWVSGSAVGIGIGGPYAKPGVISIYGKLEYRNNKSCGNKWKDYGFTGSNFTVQQLIDVNNTVPSACTVPVWDSGSSC